MDNMGQIKDIIQPKEPKLDDSIYNFVCAQWDNLMFHYMPWCTSLCQNTTLHLGWENLHLRAWLGENPIQIQRYKMGI